MSIPEDGASLHARFEEQVARTPDHVAIDFEGLQLTYRELSQRSTAVAAALAPYVRAPGQLVGLFTGRSTDMIVGLLGILKAGAAYVPIDPDYPDARIRLLMNDSGLTTVVTRRSELDRLDRTYSVVLTDGESTHRPFASPRVSGSDAAYVIYTSGSTGTPKGTVVEHRHVLRLFATTAALFDFGPKDVWTLFHSVSFDFSVWEIWGALLYGGRLVIVPSAVAADPVAFARLVERQGVTILNQTPTAFRQFARDSVAMSRSFPALRTIVFGGERLDASHYRAWVERYGVTRPRLVNMYGITETTVHVSYRPLKLSDLEEREHSPIGHPLADLQVHLLDDQLRPVPDGAPGEIVVTGAGVARGYLNQHQLTAQRYPELPLGLGGALVRSYRSGDLAVRRGDELFYMGRVDDQVKVRGYRIELGEVESQLARSPAVESCAVITRDFGEGDVRLLAFVVPRAGAENAAKSAAEHASSSLPVHMRPSRIVEIAQLPRTAHGKLDRDALRSSVELAAAERSSGMSGAPAEGRLASISALAHRILGETVSIELDLFDQGATSLSLARLILEVNAMSGLNLTGAELDGDSSILNIAAVVGRLEKQGKASVTVACAVESV
ncbi:MAG: D-alanine-poly(Phosphoribitol) ligase, subunit 1 [Myxococcaceae bacterium]|nr:D-alanine-poly(Phosphoribitol) ligase, subunit 1 [Myxococcaceae bacterium]